MRRKLYSNATQDYLIAKQAVDYLNSLPSVEAEVDENEPNHFTLWIGHDEWNWEVVNRFFYPTDREGYTIRDFKDWVNFNLR